MDDGLRWVGAGNSGAFTLDGTRTYLVGQRDVVVLDPGPDVDAHVRAVVSAVEKADTVRVLLTHHHPDHAGAAVALAEALRTGIWGPAGPGVDHPMTDGDTLAVDSGRLEAVHTPGHTRDHLCFLSPERRALFAGDVVLGRGDTTWVAEYPGCVGEYLASISRLQSMDLAVIYPTHGPPLDDPRQALARFENHRLERIEQVRRALADHPGADARQLLEVVYGFDLPAAVVRPALESLQALMEFVRSSPAT